MFRNFSQICCAVLVVLGAQRASAFSLLGDFEEWQQPVVSFRLSYQIGGSRNIGDEYRINTPMLTYGFDPSFLDYFGANGVRAVDEAFAIMNKLPAVSKASKELNEFLTDDAQRIRASAQALNLVDLKSTTLGIILEHMGLAGEDHVFDLRSRGVPPGSPPPCTFLYTVIVRNFDPVTYEPSHYVNGTLYSYDIFDGCPTLSRADAFETLVDPTDFYFTAVATTFGLQLGGYYLNITRDDFGGLRYLYRANNYNNEALPPDAFGEGSSSPWTPVDFFSTNNIAATNFPALRGGVEKVRFKKVKFDSFLGGTFKPVSTTYTQRFITNSTSIKQRVRRVTFRPDILFTAADLASQNPSQIPFIINSYFRTVSFSTNGTAVPFINNLGPGTILPQTIVTFNKMGPYFENQTGFVDEQAAFQGFLWGSFDGSTNDPIVYPQGTSIRQLEAQVLHN